MMIAPIEYIISVVTILLVLSCLEIIPKPIGIIAMICLLLFFGWAGLVLELTKRRNQNA